MPFTSKLLLSITLISLSACATPHSAKIADTEQKCAVEDVSHDVISHLSGATYITKDLQASVDFYTKYLNFSEGRRRTLDDDSARAIFGINGGETLLYTTLLPTNFTRGRKLTTLNFAQVANGRPSPLVKSASRRAVYSEPVMAFDVKNLRKVKAEIQAAGNVTIIDPLKISPTGRSLTLTVLDPNGLRVQFYEFLPGKR